MAMAREPADGAPRYDKAATLLRLARRLAGSAEGLLMSEMMEETGSGRRTVERMLDVIQELFGPLDKPEDGKKLRYRLPIGAGERWLTAPLVEEVIELDHAADALHPHAPDRAAFLRELARKLRGTMRAQERRKIDVDYEGLMRAEALALRPGPEAVVPGEVLAVLREAIMAPRTVRMRYRKAGGEASEKEVVPYGLLFGTHGYLVAPARGTPEPFMWRLDRIEAPVLGEVEAAPDEFDLKAFAERSFATFQEEPRNVSLVFAPAAVADAERFAFHPTQTVEPLPDGSLRVRFRCGGLLQIAHHLFTWGDTVRIEGPDELRAEMRAALARAATSVE